MSPPPPQHIILDYFINKWWYKYVDSSEAGIPPQRLQPFICKQIKKVHKVKFQTAIPINDCKALKATFVSFAAAFRAVTQIFSPQRVACEETLDLAL